MTGSKNNVCPLLKNPDLYNPDSEDLINNLEARDYWLSALEEMARASIDTVQALNPDDPDAANKAKASLQDFHKLIEKIKKNTSELKPLSVRTLLEYQQDNLRANNLKDAWLSQKETDCREAMKEFKLRIDKIDAVKDFDAKWLDIIQGVIAGNIFDYGARAVVNMIDGAESFGFIEASKTIEKRPWFHDDFDDWLQRIKQKPHKSCVIFVDNAGVDFVLGILPFARQLLLGGAKVILAANSLPALNDVTYRELHVYCDKAAERCGVIADAIDEKRLVFADNGQRGPCLDLSNLSPGLCELMKSADLVVIEGMGRAVHTNLYAELTVDYLKLAVLKNEWLARRLGGQQFSVICDFKTAT